MSNACRFEGINTCCRLRIANMLDHSQPMQIIHHSLGDSVYLETYRSLPACISLTSRLPYAGHTNISHFSLRTGHKSQARILSKHFVFVHVTRPFPVYAITDPPTSNSAILSPVWRSCAQIVYCFLFDCAQDHGLAVSIQGGS